MEDQKPSGNAVVPWKNAVAQAEAKMQLLIQDPVIIKKELGFAMQAIQGSSQLQGCTPISILDACLNIARTGLTLNPIFKLAYLVPRKGVAILDISYMGMCKVLVDAGGFKFIEAHVVYTDEVEAGRFKQDVIGGVTVYEPLYPDTEAEQNKRKPYGVLTIATLGDGSRATLFTPRWKIEKARRISTGSDGQYSPWKNFEDEMYKKGLDINTPIPTPLGWKNMENIQIGDQVFDMAGKVVTVIETSQIKNKDCCYKIEFTNGEVIICDDEHRWLASIGTNGSRQRKKSGWKVYEITELFKAKLNGKIISVPICGPIECEHKKILPDPWLIGFWLGDGSKSKASITCHENNIEEISAKIRLAGYLVGSIRKDTRNNAVSIGITGGFLNDLRDFGLLNNKHIPSIFLRAGVHQRLELLKGLMDSDGHISKARGEAIFCNTDRRIADAVAELAISLGETVVLEQHNMTGFGKTVLTFFVKWRPTITPVSLKAKLRNIQIRKIAPYRAIKSIVRIPTVPTKCIAVDSLTRTYLAGYAMVPTHNTAIRLHYKTLPKGKITSQLEATLDLDEKNNPVDFRKGGESVEGDILADILVDDKPAAEKEAAAPPPVQMTDSLKKKIQEIKKPDPFIQYVNGLTHMHGIPEFQEVVKQKCKDLEFSSNPFTWLK